ncbi:MAG: diphthamide biosynthesis enzyme Dph2 [Nitrososphaerota archaeon]|jgi:2-(3-amino-3-carboxypropyl)histidine synthase|uniref:diphthamide biosynthesis enzyme Dph2 n=1 Tax=Candidatus Bathycorpusculum sp. TaxID=2994959 RepID=UPI00282A11B8|nr:diphthamide biosynthesis enzyme Dph2 [Candidatus Termiticorpusculum sp.]MCL2256691.1 diphthamide biosynthesis enzyme Dph2 [Candidatus Termiticorpusculum sp.]MCL2293123.1 diphthamide biosynthesis enzyme Dph2 [Candidatus Termiticorpusculum sp.]MDR0460402.1 diphthamide biosynthesis enzyme Dph2 [Nitrososphaerota archaeon]
MNSFDFEEERLSQEIRRLGAKRVLIQMPQGLKPEAIRIAKMVEKTGALVLISADPCYGACDIATNEAESLGADLVIHFGHSKFVKHETVLTIYIEARALVNINETLEKVIELLDGYAKIGLATSVQHLQLLNEAREFLVRSGKTVVIGASGSVGYAGQVIGCDYSNVRSIVDEVDAYLFVGGGLFHALGIALSTSKPTFVVDPYDNRVFSLSEDAKKLLKQHWVCIEQARNAKNVGIIVGLKPGQNRIDDALKIKELIEKHGKNAYLLAIREVTPEVLLEFPTIDAYVNTACPRISLDAPGKFAKPLLTVNEFLVASGEASWESMIKKGLFEK